jgi:hypothetical protein
MNLVVPSLAVQPRLFHGERAVARSYNTSGWITAEE